MPRNVDYLIINDIDLCIILQLRQWIPYVIFVKYCDIMMVTFQVQKFASELYLFAICKVDATPNENLDNI